MENTESLTINKIFAVPNDGANLARCCAEAAILALQEGVRVELAFNDAIFVADPIALRETVKNQ